MHIKILLAAILLVADVAYGANHVLYFKAVTYEWDYLPNRNPIDGSPRPEPYNHCGDVPINTPDPPPPLPPYIWRVYTTDELGKKLMKAKYVKCPTVASPLDPVSWANVVCNPPVPTAEFANGEPVWEAHLGIMGPVIKASPGDTITIYLLNDLATIDTYTGTQPAPVGTPLPTFPITIEPLGLQFDKADAVAPGAVGVFKWTVPASAAPAADEPDWKLWYYKSTLNPGLTDNAGLYGPILVRRATTIKDAAAMPDVITTLQIVDENMSPFFAYNVAKYGNGIVAPLAEGLLKHAINGFLYCAIPLPHLPATVGVRWHNGALGGLEDMHTMHWHANTYIMDGRRSDVLQMLPGAQYSVYLETRATSVGTWLLHCHVDDHIPTGMVALYKIKGVKPATDFLKPSAIGGKVREYWVQAEMVLWDYAGGNADPVNKNNCPASAGAVNALQWTWTQWWKVMYVEYEKPTATNPAFTVRKTRPGYLGLQGPVLRAQVGDTIRIHFKNNLPCNDPNDPVDPAFCHPAVSIHPHGMAYLKDSEGAPYADPIMSPSPSDPKLDDFVAPGQEVEYNWGILPSSGPSTKDASTVTWFYHSHVDEVVE